MIDVIVLGDGPRDGATVPHFVETHLGVRVSPKFRAWKDLELARGGYERKLKWVAREAIADRVKWIVLTVDTDKDPQRDKLRRLRDGCDQMPQIGVLVHVAIGEATPHAEAWLLGDQRAVRESLQLPASTVIPTPVAVKDSKKALQELQGQSDRCNDPILEVLADIARRVRPTRCTHKKETGFQSFLDNLQRAFRDHRANCSEDCPCGDACDEG